MLTNCIEANSKKFRLRILTWRLLYSATPSDLGEARALMWILLLCLSENNMFPDSISRMCRTKPLRKYRSMPQVSVVFRSVLVKICSLSKAIGSANPRLAYCAGEPKRTEICKPLWLWRNSRTNHILTVPLFSSFFLNSSHVNSPSSLFWIPEFIVSS
jgi:hypothetical protein